MINKIRKIRRIFIVFIVVYLFSFLVACTSDPIEELREYYPINDVYYQVFVRSFADSDGDGVGDINGVTKKLSYLDELGVTGIWLMPIFPSPSYHGYDVTNYKTVNPEYGTIDDFKNLIKEADKLGIKVMIDMIFNHSSSEHPWFKAALAGDAKYEDYYVFAGPATNTGAIETAKNVWHEKEGKKYYGYFSDVMPDLNLDNEEVVEELYDISKFWIDLGVDGFRLDAVQHFFWINEYQNKKYTTYQNQVFTKALQSHILNLNEDFYLIGEIFNNTESIVAPYFNGLNSPLDFPVSNRLFTAISSNGNFGYVNGLKRIYDSYSEVFNNHISSPFIKNHDEDRLASLLGGDEAKLKLAAEMLLTLPGSPIIYYGEEVGMVGIKSIGELSDGISIWDETRRLPFPFKDEYQTTWFDDPNFNGVTENQAIDLVAQMQSNDSIWRTYQNILKVRNENIALKYGNSFTPFEDNTAQIQGFYREIDERGFYQKLLILHNLSLEKIELGGIIGDIIYSSGDSGPFGIDAKSTLIIDLTEVKNG